MECISLALRFLLSLCRHRHRHGHTCTEKSSNIFVHIVAIGQRRKRCAGKSMLPIADSISRCTQSTHTHTYVVHSLWYVQIDLIQMYNHFSSVRSSARRKNILKTSKHALGSEQKLQIKCNRSEYYSQNAQCSRAASLHVSGVIGSRLFSLHLFCLNLVLVLLLLLYAVCVFG